MFLYIPISYNLNSIFTKANKKKFQFNANKFFCRAKSPGCVQMQQWFNLEGERHLLEAESVEDSGDRMELILNTFTGFLIEANVSVCFTSPLATLSVLKANNFVYSKSNSV